MRKLAFLASFLLTSLYVHAQQPSVCSPGQPPAENCNNACINCNFNGYTGSTIGFTPDGGQGFCGSVENNQWLGFIAGAGSAIFTVTPFGCLNNNGVQIALYAACGLNPIICNGGDIGGGNIPLNINSALTPGASYFLMIDGYLGDECSFDVSVSPAGAAVAPPLSNSIGNISGPNSICPGTTAQYTIPTVTNAGAYTWSVPPGWLVNGVPGPLSVLAPGGKKVQITAGTTLDTSFQICVKASNACYPDGPSACKTVRVENNPPSVMASGGTTTCTVGSIPLSTTTNAINPVFYWDGPNGFSSNSPSPMVSASGIYYVTVTDSYTGCTASATTTVGEDHDVPNATAIGSMITCTQSTVPIIGSTSTPGGVLSWTGPGGFQSTQPSVTVNTVGDYLLTVTAPNGCTSSAIAQVIPDLDLPNATAAGGTLSCLVQNIMLDGGSTTPNIQFFWTGPYGFTSNQLDPIVLQAGVYTLYVTNPGNNCSAQATAFVYQGDVAPGAIASGATITCANLQPNINVLTLSNGVSYSWTGPNNFVSDQQSPIVMDAGDYFVTVTDLSNGCFSLDSTRVTIDQAPPLASATAGILSCVTSTTALQASATLPADFSWSGPNNFQSNQQNPSVVYPGEYSITATAANGCTGTAMVTVAQDTASPSVFASGGTIDCTSGQVILMGSSQSIGASFSWAGPNNFQSNLQNPSVSFEGQYWLTVNGTNGCSATSLATVMLDNQAPQVSLSGGGTLTCANPSITLMANADTIVSWQWTGPGNFNSNQQDPTVFLPGQYKVYATAYNGCIGSTEINIEADTLMPNGTISPPGPLTCSTRQLELSCSTGNMGAFSFLWTTSNGHIITGANTSAVLIDQAGIYQVRITDTNNGCVGLDMATVDEDANMPTAAAIQPHGVSCFGDANGSASIDTVTGGTPPYLYALDQKPFGLLSTFKALAPGMHSLVIQDIKGCEYETSFQISEPEEMRVDLGADTTIHLGTPILISLAHIGDFQGREVQTRIVPSDLPIDTAFIPDYTIHYQATIVDSNGCEVSDDRIIIVDPNPWVYIPNVFAPGSSDNYNLTIYGGPDVERIKSFFIFDRWGNVLHEAHDFEKNDLNNGWDGKFRGQAINPGVYSYYAEVRFKAGETLIYKGAVTLIR